MRERDEAVERLAARAPAPVLLTCEHASARLPAPWRWPDEDAWLVRTHWAYDLGAAALVHELAAELGAGALLSRFSRLLVDPNRPPESPALIRTEAEGRPVALNASLSDGDREARLAYWRAYHDALDQAVSESEASVLLAIHTFTPDYPGESRDHIEVGVLFDTEEELAVRLRDALAAAGMAARLNEPYSGRQGLIYAADRHARAHGRRAVEIELRQDRALDARFRRALALELARFAW